MYLPAMINVNRSVLLRQCQSIGIIDLSMLLLSLMYQLRHNDLCIVLSVDRGDDGLRFDISNHAIISIMS